MFIIRKTATIFFFSYSSRKLVLLSAYGHVFFYLSKITKVVLFLFQLFDEKEQRNHVTFLYFAFIFMLAFFHRTLEVTEFFPTLIYLRHYKKKTMVRGLSASLSHSSFSSINIFLLRLFNMQLFLPTVLIFDIKFFLPSIQ
jgi:hypothetical protein